MIIPFDEYFRKSIGFVKEFEQLIYKNQWVRWKMKRLVYRYRLRMLRQVNEEDIFTMEPPKNAIFIYDWTNRCKYMFEATTIYKDMCERLFVSDLLFPSPKRPRNPFTNLPLTDIQFQFVMKDLIRYGLTNWALSAFSKTTDIQEFELIYYMPLKIIALKRLFTNQISTDCIDLVFDFIAAEYEFHYKTLRYVDMWLWYLEHRIRAPRIREWRRVCYEYYMNLFTKPPEIHQVYLDSMREITGRLVSLDISDMLLVWKSSR